MDQKKNIPMLSNMLANSISEIQTITGQFQEAIQIIQEQLLCQLRKKNILQDTIRQKLNNIDKLLERINNHVLTQQNHLQAMNTSSTQLAEQILSYKQFCLIPKAPNYELTYLINSVKQYKLLSLRIAEADQQLSRLKIKKDDQIRTLKIRISLAEIELKELRNRVKKI